MKNKRKIQETKSLSAPPWSQEVEEIILNTIFKHGNDKMTGSSQQRKIHALPTLLINTYNELTSLVNELESLLGPLLFTVFINDMDNGQMTFSEYFKFCKTGRSGWYTKYRGGFKISSGMELPQPLEQCVFLFCYPHRKKKIIAVPQWLILQAVVLWLCCYSQRPP